MRRWIIASVVAALAVAQEQVHLSMTGVAGQMHVSYAVPGSCSKSNAGYDTVLYGTSPNTLTYKVSASNVTYTTASLCIYDATMSGLQPQTKYYYQIASRSFSFVNQPARDGGKVYAVLADFGLSNDVSMEQLVAEASSNEFDAVIHAGDFAYNLETTSSTVGNGFLNAIEPVVATRPYMTCPGNHESDAQTFKQYLTRFGGTLPLAKNSGSNSQLWYSFNDGLVHWVSIDTELFSYGGTQAQIDAQYAWLTADLAAVDRSVTPWVIAFGHKQGWMDKVQFTQLESILQDAKVDLYFCGHQHNYQRLLPQRANVVETGCVSSDQSVYANCQDMITLVVGSPGCKEKLSSGQAPNGVAEFFQAYGFGHLTVVNSTHVHWEWEEMKQMVAPGVFRAAANAYADELWVVKSQR